MPVRIIGMIGVSPPADKAVLFVTGGAVSGNWLAATAKEHDAAGYDEVLVGYHSKSADGFAAALYAAAQSERLSFLLAHRPGRILPALLARKIATFDNLAPGRISLHIIIGGSDTEQKAEGDFSSKDERYARGAEFLEIVRTMWTSNRPFDFRGKFYQIEGGYSEVKPMQKPYPTIAFGGSSVGALEMGSQHCDVFAMYGEPLSETEERITDFRQRCEVHGRVPRFNISFRPIIAETEGKAWDKAHNILADIRESQKGIRPTSTQHGGERLVALARKSEVHDERLWMPIAESTAGNGNTTCLVGTPEQVVGALMKYYALGVHSFLLRGFDPMADVAEFGRELIPCLRRAAAQFDAGG